jgi:hypothetical protein
MKPAALGFRVHSGWTAVVALSLTNREPQILARQRIHLVENFIYKFRQPYHTAMRLPIAEARKFVKHMESQATRLAYRAILAIQKDLQTKGYRLTHCGLVLASGRKLPGLPQILASHALIHTADGELFRRAILRASARCALATKTAKERELAIEASRALHIKPETLARRIVDLGRPLGAPWTQDEKLSSLIAWFALASKP